MRIGIVSCNKYKNKIMEDILLKKTINTKGFECNIVSWESDNIDDYAILILRSIWGYQFNYEKFLKWLQYIEDKNIILINNYDIVKEDIDKEVQYNILVENNIPLIPYKIIDINNNVKKEIMKVIDYYVKMDYNKFVIKPTISGSGSFTYLYDQKNNDSLDIIVKKIKKMKYIMPYQKIIIQPFFKEIKDGEFSCVLLNGKISHKMVRFPGVLINKKEVIQIDKLQYDEKRLVKTICGINNFNKAVFMRVDYIRVKKDLKIMELELVDPDLLTRNINDKNKRIQFIDKLANEIIKRGEKELCQR